MYELIRNVVDAKFTDAELTVIESRDGMDSGNLEKGTLHIVYLSRARNIPHLRLI